MNETLKPREQAILNRLREQDPEAGVELMPRFDHAYQVWCGPWRIGSSVSFEAALLGIESLVLSSAGYDVIPE